VVSQTALRDSLILLPSIPHHFDRDLVAFLQNVSHSGCVLQQFRNVQKAVGAREELNESSEVRDTNDLAQILFPTSALAVKSEMI
jgi:hypothetical protein